MAAAVVTPIAMKTMTMTNDHDHDNSGGLAVVAFVVVLAVVAVVAVVSIVVSIVASNGKNRILAKTKFLDVQMTGAAL